MHAEYVLTMEAHNAERNHHRLYEFIVGRDLFNHWILTIRYARVGHSGHHQHFSAPDLDSIQKIISARLKQRATAPKRIGCEYTFREPAIREIAYTIQS